MSKKPHDPISSLNRSRTDWKIKVKVIRNWRAASKNGELYKAFNIILIDEQESKIHAFIPSKCAQRHESSLQPGTVCYIKNFTIQRYKEDDRFRPVHDENQIVFSTETIVKIIEDNLKTFPDDAFDFYDHSELQALADKTPYLIDVVGIIENLEAITLREIITKQQRKQFQIKFKLTDGSSNVPVTFWDATAQRFHRELLLQEDEPVIVILTSCKCGSWNRELDLSNVAATTFYFNYNHHSVKQIKKMTSTQEYTQKKLGKQKRNLAELHNIEEIKNLGIEYIQAYVILHANLRYIDEVQPWISFICTECKQMILQVNDSYKCLKCNKRIPHPEKRFNLNVVASDLTGPLEILLQDREVRILTGKTAEEVFSEHQNPKTYPNLLKNLARQNVTMKLWINEANITKGDKMYLATNICTGFWIPDQIQLSEPETMQQSTLQASTSTYHLEGISELNFH